MNNTSFHTITTASRRRLIAFAAILALGAGTDAAHAADAPASKPPTDDVAIHLSDVDRERMETPEAADRGGRCHPGRGRRGHPRESSLRLLEYRPRRRLGRPALEGGASPGGRDRRRSGARGRRGRGRPRPPHQRTAAGEGRAGPEGDQEACGRRAVRRLHPDRGQRGPRRGRRRCHHEGQERPSGAQPADRGDLRRRAGAGRPAE